MNCKINLILAFILPLLAGCSRAAVSPAPAYPSETVSKASPSGAGISADDISPADKNTLLTDKLPSGISEDFLAWIHSRYGSGVSDSLRAALGSGTCEDTLWYDLTGNTLPVLKDRFSGFPDSPETAKAHNIYLKESAVPHQVTLSFAGDISFADGYANMAAYASRGGTFLDTLDALSQAGIPYVGAGRNLEEAKEYVSFLSGGMKISYVSATQIERSTIYTKGATETSPGVLRTDDSSACLDAIDAAKADSDFVVVFVHWGTEGTNYFEEDQRQLARLFIDHGAGLVIGCHPHVLQGIEYYHGVPVIYSLGNFWFNSRTLATGLIEATISVKGLEKLQFIPALQKDCQTSLVTSPGEKEKALRFMEDLSNGVAIDGEGFITQLTN
ncbi:CapA family protein [Lachnospiraceae bacterium 54-53]